MARHDPIPDEHELLRYIKRRFLSKDDGGDVETDPNGSPAFAFPEAFRLREGEAYLSLTSRNLHSDDRNEGIRLGAKAIEKSTESGKLTRSSAVALALNEQLKDACAGRSYKVRVLEEPEDENEGHVAVRNYPSDAAELEEELSSNVFVEKYFIGDIL